MGMKATATPAQVEASPSGVVLLLLPRESVAALEQRAARLNESLDQLLARIIAKELDDRG